MGFDLKFRHKILLAAGLTVVFAFTLFVLFNDYKQRQTLQANATRSMADLGELTTSNVQTWLQGNMSLVDSMAQQISVEGSALDKLKSIVGLPVYGTAFQISYFGGADGLMFSVPAASRAADYDPRARGWYKAAMTAGRTVVTEPYVAASSGKLVITVATPVKRAGETIGVAGADIDLASVSAIINSLNFDGHGNAFIVNADGKILIHPDKELILKNLTEAFPGSGLTAKNGLSEVESNGKALLVHFNPLKGIPSANWQIGLALEQSFAFSMLKEFRVSAAIATVIAVIVIITLLSILTRVLMQPLFAMGRAMQDIADGEGDLTRRLVVVRQDEFGQLGTAFNRFVERVHQSIKDVASATLHVNQVASRVVSASNASLLNSDQQVSRTTSVAAAINELGAAAQEIARNAAIASEHSADASALSAEGQQVLGQSITSMRELSQKISESCGTIETLNAKTVNIGQILEVITSISQQTNLLALNAAIEAARAGEAGRGFAVVADEVRNLAHRTQESAQQVQQMIDELQTGSRSAVSTMEESQRQSDKTVQVSNLAGERLGSVTVRIDEIDSMNQSVATATEEQTAVVESINQDITEINTLNRDGVENLRTTLQACKELEQQAAQLSQLVKSFRI
ncbi:methyl-accepting chemotaxis protein [Pseudomonas sp. CG7]|uniref:methyl-accepting chemotaxis protein n=1 Tax=Pseudomonas sp. CG7 TaxID=191007 RepID=UPI0020332187|nr:methyl-accepting chemotaxis protein [Pseudomonas sp. CG7]MCM2459433.1 methyl-accepting chemotaxis protein [Pseudomonas sp. CG7]